MRWGGRYLLAWITVACVLAVVVTSAADAWSRRAPAATVRVGPVSPRLLRFLDSDGPGLRPAGRRASPTVSKSSAVGAALREGQWHPATATGISLVRIEHRAGKVPAGSLAWLVSITPRTPIVDRPGGRPANYVVVVVSARDGRLLGDAAGYSPALGHRMGSS